MPLPKGLPSLSEIKAQVRSMIPAHLPATVENIKQYAIVPNCANDSKIVEVNGEESKPYKEN